MRKEDDAGGKFICCVMLPLLLRRRHPRSVLNLNEGFFARGEKEEAE